VATHLQAVEPSRHPLALDPEGASPLEELCQHYPRLQPGEGCTDTVVDSTAERQVVTRRETAELHLVGLIELLCITVGGAPKTAERHLIWVGLETDGLLA
jgi:hypothetical protein